MRFFEKKRVEVFLHNPRLRRDKKTNLRLWTFTLIVTFGVELAESCDVSIAKAWQYITERDSAAIDVQLASEVDGCAIDFFAQIDDADPVLHLNGVDLVGLRLTRNQLLVEFWFSGEHENPESLHKFMKPYAFQRLFAQFSPAQGELALGAASKQQKKKK